MSIWNIITEHVNIPHNINRTTFDNIVSSGQIEYLQNQALTDSIIKYYSDGSNIGWDSGLREYSRNIIAPYLLRFDHIPPKPQTSYRENASREFTQVDVSKSKIAQKSIEDYMDDVFILNVIRQKIYMFEGQIMEYENLKETIGQLKKNLQAELDWQINQCRVNGRKLPLFYLILQYLYITC